MDKQQLILHEQLEVAHRLQIKVRRERLGDDEVPAYSGLAWVDSCPVLFLDTRISSAEAVQVLVRELADFPLEDIYMKPGIRALLEPGEEDGAAPG